MTWITIAEYCKKMGIKNPEVIYNKIAMNKMGKVKWREIEITKKLKQIYYEQ